MRSGCLDDAEGLPQAPFRVDVLNWWEHGPSDVQGCLHHPLEGLVAADGAIPIQSCDATEELKTADSSNHIKFDWSHTHGYQMLMRV
jgi:hypothetical protein